MNSGIRNAKQGSAEVLFAVGAVAMLLGAGAAQAALAPEQKCEAGKNNTAGKYVQCMSKAEKTLVTTGDQAKYDAAVLACGSKFGASWSKLEAAAQAANTTCPSMGDQSSIQDFLDACEQSVAEALGGGTLGPDPVTCASDLTTCDGSLTICTGSLATCTGDLGTCSAVLTTCSTDLSSTNADLGTCAGSLATCSSNLGTCNTNLATTHADLGTCNTNYATCSASLGTATSGTAAAGDVLAGKTFTSSAGLGVTGTMPDNGAVSITPGTSAQTIAAGYHNGSGQVAGDADLAASNIVLDVNIFGVTGTALPAQPLKTGQTTSYGTGSDGNLQKGVARAFTDNGDGTITDTKTGLMWEKKSDDGSIHDKDNAYTWGMSVAPYTMNGTMMTTFLAALNAAPCFAGYCDWRIPSEFELYTLVNLQIAYPGPTVHSAFNSCAAGCAATSPTCSCTQPNYYWSSTTYQNFADNAWGVYFYDGYTGAHYKTYNGYVRAVRAGS